MEYLPPWWARNGHLQSVYPSVFRKVSADFYTRERLETPDQDFIDLDWAKNKQSPLKRLVVLSHGLEGHSKRPYILGMAKIALQNNWDVLAWNFRSCSGEPNRKLQSYHSGQTGDLQYVVKHAIAQGYEEVCLVGFSIGGNKTLLYLGRESEDVPKEVSGAVTFSVPCDLTSSSKQLALPQNKIYMKNFLFSLKAKLKEKKLRFPQEVDLTGFRKLKTFYDFDQRYTAPLNGFASAEEYWYKSSSSRYIEQINTPTLLISALDDPFLTKQCFPHEAAKSNPCFELETPRFGGHVGFMGFNKEGLYWSEERAIEYLNRLSRF
ncbi:MULTISPECIES: YheT family hydrolase [unclassified Oleiphilus]|jgi:predicted alpha/beta-fold hydrolase|uniref:YheT family hydrolase n=3 Tax=Oleiphilus TaxID=141450 RepID=UPI0007C220A4|nr:MULTISPECIES: alpha/beta fold hydrolase [unclassified Oleiphilus]KZY41482.1 alpha/beta hydrolase [Oleiphilus sp. HI0050]KZY76127.1 alpha/beta hydrolase [Oleiphilus sp. HI0068]KZY81379.1 alpha/beta hydrolase [Oleiphilus sp. HI0069]KZZ09782.1 alpha/beta hydrolase [Oleiphilus sp. HI0078]KZZ28482.1 alpha/beta hydrolase [Oleiphilus sp. HI0081]KZZ37055.1 alpha/beta hydrolase [Oleiphilus sp. HI0085]